MEHSDLRKEEIIKACRELYDEYQFKDITMKLISEKTSFSRPSIYNYFETKEEIFLALFAQEYDEWTSAVMNIYNNNDTLSKDEFADKLAKTIQDKERLLKLLSMNMYDLEENSRLERLIDFKKSYREAVHAVKMCVEKFFNMNDKECSDNYEWNTDFFPAATGTKYNYAVVNNEKLDDVYKLPKKIKKAIEDKKYFLAYNLGQDVDDEKVSIINAIVQSISNYVTDSYNLSANLIDADNGDKVMAVYISSYNDTSAMDNLSDKVTEKINKAVDKAFSDFAEMSGMEDEDLGDITSSSRTIGSSDEAIENESLNEGAADESE